MAPPPQRSHLIEMTATLVAAHVSNNTVALADLKPLINQVYGTLLALQTGETMVVEKAPEKLQPAVPIKKSVMQDYIICLEDGKKLKMLKRHLKTAYSMTPEQYRERWNLPADYPMVAPKYAQQRSTLAKQSGLGKNERKKRQKVS